MTISSQSAPAVAPKPPLTREQQKWVDRTMERLSLREKLGQMLVLYSFGQFSTDEDPDYKEMVREVEENRVGGFILGAKRGPLGVELSQAYPSAVLINDLQRRAEVPLFFSADFEQGAGMRVDEGTSFPSEMAVAATGRPLDAYTVGRITAREARAIGVNWIYAPVADVNINPDNPIINIRSYGEDPQAVAAFVSEFVRGAQENGALATAKHFPGHGDVNTDSHLTIPTVPGDRKRLESVEWVPFRAAISAGVDSIMTGHLAVPAIEPDATLPATLSPAILQGILRDELGFQGVIVADALEMDAIKENFSSAEAAVRAVTAGVDVLLLPPSPDATLAALEGAVENGKLPQSRVDEAVRRILSAKARLNLPPHPQVDIGSIAGELRKPEYLEAAQDIANRGVTLLRNSPNLIPQNPAKPSRVLLVAISGDPDPYPGREFENALRPYVDSLTVVRADTQFAPARALQLPSPDSYDFAIVGLFVRVTDRKGTVGLPDDEAAIVQQLAAGPKPVVIACFGNPYLIERFPNAATWITAFSGVSASQKALADAIFGEIPIQGRIPVSVPPLVKRGDGLHLAAQPLTLQPAPESLSAKLQPAYDLLDHAVADRAYPGGVLAVGLQNQLAVHPFGHFTYDAKSPAVSAETIYDVASLTKVVATTTAIMLLVNEGEISLDAPIVHFLPEFGAGPDSARRSKVTIRELLLHTSGLPAHRDYFKTAKGKASVVAQVCAEPLTADPGSHAEYSDLGFILLGEIVQRVTGESLDDYAAKNIFEPLGMSHTFFNPAAAMKNEVAPTEFDEAFRHRQLHGEVDDSNAYAMGGVAGHAGLFSTAGDLSIFAQMMLNGGIYAKDRLLPRSTIQEFTAAQILGDTRRALGWDVPTEPSSSGRNFSPASFGHLGYTGTSIWIDPQRQLFVILLTNRVYPSAANEKIRDVRPAVHDAIMQSLGQTAAGSQ